MWTTLDSTVIRRQTHRRLEHDKRGYSWKPKAASTASTTHRTPIPSEQAQVAVVLGFFNGQPYIAEQLQSIFQQSHQALHIYLCDDQSAEPFNFDDSSLQFKKQSQVSVISRSHNLGFTCNFLSALASIDRAYQYFAFSDQDDVWQPDKLAKAIEALSALPDGVPALFCARTEIANANCTQVLGYSPLFQRAPSFANALVQNIGGGNTMVFNRAARDLIVASSLDAVVVSHDWWCYQIVTGAGGHVVYDPEPCLQYRQHGNNLVGSNASWSARLQRIRGLLKGHFRTWNDINIKALLNHKHMLTAENLKLLQTFAEARQSNLFRRITLFKRSGIYRQTLLGNLGLIFGLFLNKV